MGRKKQHHLTDFLDSFLSVYLQSAFCLHCTLIQPVLCLTAKRNLTFWNPEMKCRARGSCTDSDLEATVNQGLKAPQYSYPEPTDPCMLLSVWLLDQHCAALTWWLEGKPRWLLVMEELQAASTQCQCLHLLHGLVFIWQRCKKLPWEHCFCLTVKMMNMAVFF